jgi:signal transduction histidine kinase/BarA-like signal transduction histidine kinase
MFRFLQLSTRLRLLIGLFVLTLTLFAWWCLKSLNEVRVGGPVYQRIAASKDLRSDLMPPPLYLGESYLTALELNQSATSAEQEALTHRLETLREQTREHFERWKNQLDIHSASRERLTSIHAGAERFFRLALGEYSHAVLNARATERTRLLQRLTELFQQQRVQVDAAISAARLQEKQDEIWVEAQTRRITNRLLGALFGTVLAMAALAWLIYRSIAQPLAQALGIAQAPLGGQPHVSGPKYADEPGRLVTALQTMSARLARQVQALEQAQAQSHQARELLDQHIEAAGIISVGIDRDGRVISFNQMAERFSGYSREQVLGEPWETIRQRLSLELTRHDGPGNDPITGPVFSQEITAPGGDHRRVIWRCSRLEVDDGLDSGAPVVQMSFGLDLSALYPTAKTWDAAAKQDAQADQSKRLLVHGLGYDIRSAMHTILGMSRIASRAPEARSRQRCMQEIKTAARALLATTNNVTDFFQIDAGVLNLDERQFVLNDILDELTAMNIIEADAKGQLLQCEVAGDVPAELLGDPGRLLQILQSLIEHAIQTSDAGAIRLGVHCVTTDASGALLRFEIQDDGKALGSLELAQLFEDPFAPVFESSGAFDLPVLGVPPNLSLGLCRRLVEIMKGRLWVECGPGTGNRYVLSLQFKCSADAGKHRQIQSQSLSQMRLLIIETDPLAGEILLDLLSSLQLEADIRPDAATGLDALHQAFQEAKPYQIVLINWPTPDQNELEILQQFQKYPASVQDLAVIIITANRCHETSQAPGTLRIAATLDKPIDSRALLSTLHRAQQCLHDRRTMFAHSAHAFTSLNDSRQQQCDHAPVRPSKPWQCQ